MTVYKHCIYAALTMAASIAVGDARAATTSFDFNAEFSGGTAPQGADLPWVTALFDDHGMPGSVTLDISAAGLTGTEHIAGLYFNLDPALDPGSLSFTYDGAMSTGEPATELAGVDAFKADGDGYYDIFLQFPPPPGNASFGAGETVRYAITGIPALTAQSFYFLSTSAGGQGPFYAAAHIQGVACSGLSGCQGSGWIAPVPVPAAMWLFGPAILGLAARRQRRHPGAA